MILNKRRSFFSFLPSFKGKIRISRLIYFNNQNLSKPYVLTLNKGVKMAVLNLIENIGYELFINGIYESKLLHHLIRNLPLNGSFIDVGANIGAISVPLAFNRPDLKIYAIEASPHIFKYLEYNKNINNLTNITLINKAIHIEDDLILDFFAPKEKFGKGSFSNVFTNDAEKVVTAKMDSLIALHNIHPDYVKVDVEGYESYVFQSLNEYLNSNKKRPTIIFEFVDWCERIALGESEIGKAQQFLLDKGYRLFEFENQNNEIVRPITANSCDIIAFYK